MNVEMMEQGSESWHAVRLGRVTASRVCDLMARTKVGWGASRANYQAELIVERLTGQSADKYVSPEMRWGSEVEPDARAAYEFRFNCDVALVGFVHHPTIAMAGASPDGLIGDDGLIEIKCPNTATHLDTLLAQKVPGRYVTQATWQMACTGRQWVDFVSFDPRLPAHMQLFVKRIERDDKAISEMEQMVADFLGELDAKLAMLDKLYGERAAA